ncbi:uncharacterized protein [Miscanthus floridulus]|uniref:uncharacterized protein n=1 Tax=Miscanthus floridulus TaxID=154761 RepID=UPI003457B430
MHLVNTFEESFDDLDGYSEEHARVKLLASSMSNSVVSLASFEEIPYFWNVRRFTCTGTIFRHTPYEMTILTSASLVRCLGNEAKFVNKLKIKVCLPNGKLAVGKLWKYDCNYNIAVVKTKSFPEFHGAHIHGVQFNSELFQTNLAAIGRCYESGQLMASSGMLLHKNSILDCQELMVSTCKITKAGIGGPLIDSSGNFVGMNFYSEDETPFLPVSILLKCFKHFEISGEEHAAEVARARHEEKKLDEHRKRAGRTVESPIMLSTEGDEDEDDTARLSELIALAEAGLQAEEDDDVFFTQAANEAEAAYDRRHGGQSNVGEPTHMNEEEENMFLSQAADEAEATYYRRKADQGNIVDAPTAEVMALRDGLLLGASSNILAAPHLMEQVIDSEASHPQMDRAKVTSDERREDILSCECDFKI